MIDADCFHGSSTSVEVAPDLPVHEGAKMRMGPVLATQDICSQNRRLKGGVVGVKQAFF